MLSKRQSAFTLVELSIVLVILGLLVGGVLTGQSLIRAAELRTVTTQYNNYVPAVQTFRSKYFALPGDMPNATSFWGAAAVGAACQTTAGSGTQTCDGDANGLINTATNSLEYFRAWQQLASAGLIEGNYDGINHTFATTANSPVGKISSTLWGIYGWSTRAGDVHVFDGEYGNALFSVA